MDSILCSGHVDSATTGQVTRCKSRDLLTRVCENHSRPSIFIYNIIFPFRTTFLWTLLENVSAQPAIRFPGTEAGLRPVTTAELGMLLQGKEATGSKSNSTSDQEGASFLCLAKACLMQERQMNMMKGQQHGEREQAMRCGTEHDHVTQISTLDHSYHPVFIYSYFTWLLFVTYTHILELQYYGKPYLGVMSDFKAIHVTFLEVGWGPDVGDFVVGFNMATSLWKSLSAANLLLSLVQAWIHFEAIIDWLPYAKYYGQIIHTSSIPIS